MHYLAKYLVANICVMLSIITFSSCSDVNSKLRLALNSYGHVSFEKTITDVKAAVENGADPNLLKNDLRPIDIALEAGDIELFSLLVARGLRLDAYDVYGDGEIDYEIDDDALTYSLRYGVSNEMIKILLEAGAEPHGNKESDSPISLAARSGSLELVKLLIKSGAELNYGDRGNALESAVGAGDLVITKYLVEAGAKSIDEKSSFYEGLNSNNPELVTFLLSIYKDVGKLTEIYTIASSNLANADEPKEAIKAKEIIQLLEKHGLVAPVGSYDMALYVAATNRDQSLVDFLLNKGAKFDYIGYRKKTALIILAERDLSPLVRSLEGDSTEPAEKSEVSELKMVTLMLKQGVDLNHADEYGRTALMYAAKQLKESLVKLLLKYKADKSLKDKKGKTAYDYAVTTRPKGPSKEDKAARAFMGMLGMTPKYFAELQRRSDSIAKILAEK